jgi:hypothetical protein
MVLPRHGSAISLRVFTEGNEGNEDRTLPLTFELRLPTGFLTAEYAEYAEREPGFCVFLSLLRPSQWENRNRESRKQLTAFCGGNLAAVDARLAERLTSGAERRFGFRVSGFLRISDVFDPIFLTYRLTPHPFGVDGQHIRGTMHGNGMVALNA